MVSVFLEEVGGLLEFEGKQACLRLEHQTQGYFTNEMLISQVHDAIDIFESKYPEAQGMWIFDNAPSHMKKPEDALNPDHMNVKDSGKQPFVMDTWWDGEVQKMTLDDGRQKGMRTVLEERGVNTYGMNAEKLRKELKLFEVTHTYTHIHTACTYIHTHTYTNIPALTHAHTYIHILTRRMQLSGF